MPGHEIVLVFAAELVDRALYDQPTLPLREDSGEELLAIWKPLSDFDPEGDLLVPEALLPRLRELEPCL